MRGAAVQRKQGAPAASAVGRAAVKQCAVQACWGGRGGARAGGACAAHMRCCKRYGAV